MTTDRARVEALGPAESILQMLLTYADHMVHNRPGLVTPDTSSTVGVRWEPATWIAEEDGTKVVHRLVKQGKKASVRLQILRGAEARVDTTVMLPAGRAFTVKGPKVDGGAMIYVMTYR